MTLLDACTTFCTQLETTFGTQTVQLVCTGAAVLLVWLQSKKKIAASDAKAVSAQQSANEAHLQIAAIKGSLRPAALVAGVPSIAPPVLSSSASQTNLEPVVMPELHPSTPTPDSVSFPKPPRMPSEASTALEDEVITRPERPSAKRPPS